MRKCSPKEIIDSPLTRPCKPAMPKRPHLWRPSTPPREQVGFDKKNRAIWLQACDHVVNCGLCIGNVMKYRARCDQIKRLAFNRTGKNVHLAQFKIRHANLN